MLKKDAREPYKEIGVAQCFQGLRRFCFQTREYKTISSNVKPKIKKFCFYSLSYILP